MQTKVVANFYKCYCYWFKCIGYCYWIDLSRIINYIIDEYVLSICYHRFVYTLLNYRVHSVIDDITGKVARADNPEAAPPAEEANQVPPESGSSRRTN